MDLIEVGRMLERARAVALDYRRLTGRPLGITGEIGEFEAARLLDLLLAPAREPGFDAVDRGGRRYQIKTRCIPRSKERKSQQIGSIKLDRPWDAVLLVLLNDGLQPLEIWQADRDAVAAAILAPGSKARNERGALAVSRFKSIGRCVWSATDTTPGVPRPLEGVR